MRALVLAPVLVGSAAKGIGCTALLDAAIKYLPHADEEPRALLVSVAAVGVMVPLALDSLDVADDEVPPAVELTL